MWNLLVLEWWLKDYFFLRLINFLRLCIGLFIGVVCLFWFIIMVVIIDYNRGLVWNKKNVKVRLVIIVVGMEGNEI